MIASALSPAHARTRRAIAAHFAGRTSTATETAMRAHLLTCLPCKGHYQRHLTLARLDPRALPAEERIARGLGLRVRAFGGGHGRARLIAGLTVSVATVAALAIFPVRTPDQRIDPARAMRANADFTARGTDVAAERAVAFWTYRVGGEGTPRLADRAIRRDDELAFAYSNPIGKAFLMIFGVDEHRHVYWFHPAWPAGQPAPTAIRAVEGPGPHELPGAIRQALDGRRLNVYAALSDRALDVKAVEAAVGLPTASDMLPALGDSVVVVGRTYEVQP